MTLAIRPEGTPTLGAPTEGTPTMATLTLGTRGSPLALAQAHETAGRLAAAHGCARERFCIRIIKTSGDLIQDRALSEAGGKGLFTKELDEALLRGEIDAGVHSAKDLPTILPEGIVIGGYLAREDVRDALIARGAASLDALPPGAVVGTASLRRAAQVKRLRPDLATRLLRGNVETRLRKVEAGEYDATLLALAGMNRLGLAHHASAVLAIGDFLPACGQGAVAVTLRAGDAATAAALAAIYDADTGSALAAERAFLGVLDGSCRTPIAGHATVRDGEVQFIGQVYSTDGARTFSAERAGPSAEAAALGEAAAREILARMPAGFLRA